MNFARFLIESEARVEALRRKYLPAMTEKWANSTYMRRMNYTAFMLATQDFNNMHEFTAHVANHAYLDWAIRMYLKLDNAHHFNFAEDYARWGENIENYHVHKHQMPVEFRDINRFKTYSELVKYVEPYINQLSNKEIKRQEVQRFKKDITVVYEGPEGMVCIPHTVEASNYLGRGTQWCTAAKTNNYFNQYNRDGSLYCLIHSDGTKWQFHLQTGQFMDQRDNPLPWASIDHDPLFAKVRQRFFAQPMDLQDMINFAMDDTQDRIPEIEQRILDHCSPIQISMYVQYKIRHRWPEAERVILATKDPDAASHYAVNVIHGQWKEFEHQIEGKFYNVDTHFWEIIAYYEVLGIIPGDKVFQILIGAADGKGRRFKELVDLDRNLAINHNQTWTTFRAWWNQAHGDLIRKYPELRG